MDIFLYFLPESLAFLRDLTFMLVIGFGFVIAVVTFVLVVIGVGIVIEIFSIIALGCKFSSGSLGSTFSLIYSLVSSPI